MAKSTDSLHLPYGGVRGHGPGEPVQYQTPSDRATGGGHQHGTVTEVNHEGDPYSSVVRDSGGKDTVVHIGNIKGGIRSS